MTIRVRPAHDGDLQAILAINNQGEDEGRRHGCHKFVLFTFAFDALGQGLYRKMGYGEVGSFREQGVLEKILGPCSTLNSDRRPR